jgi:hypothetical protein
MRTITKSEYDFLVRVEKTTGKDLHPLGLAADSKVEPMLDGGMGSLRFGVSTGEKAVPRLGQVFAQGEFNDEDGTPVSFTINLDSDGRLFELDLWRVDFEPLKRLPTENDTVNVIAESA